jgi:hypothetical protein
MLSSYDHRICSQVIHNRGHGFSKRLNPIGVHNFAHTCQPTLNANILAISLESRQRVVDHDLYLTFAQTMGHALEQPAITGRVLKSVPKDVRRDQDQSRTPLEPGHALYAIHLFTNIFYAYAKWKARTM